MLICFAGPFTSDNGNEEADNNKACVDQDSKDNHEGSTMRKSMMRKGMIRMARRMTTSAT